MVTTVMLVKYKDLKTGEIISDSHAFAEQFRRLHCKKLKLETVERLIYIISSYIVEEERKANLSIITYSNYYRDLVGQGYEEKDIKNGVKLSIIGILNDIYEYNSYEDAQNTILNRSFKPMERTLDSGKEVWVEKFLPTNRYLSPLLHLLGIKEFEDIGDFISSSRFPKNYPLEKINSVFKEMFSNIREATIRNLNPTKIEDFTPEQKADRKFRSVIVKCLNEEIRTNPSENVPHNPTKVSFSEEPQLINTYSYKPKNDQDADVSYSYSERNITRSDNKENIDNSYKRKLREVTEESSPNKKRFVETLLEEKRDEKHCRVR